MKASDLSLLELLKLSPDTGTIKFNDRRMLLWDADAFGNLRNELIASLGVEQARPLLKRFGFANGYRDAITTKNLFQWDNDEEWWRSCPALQRCHGKVMAAPEHLVVDKENGIFEMRVKWDNSYEAQQHVRVFGEVACTVCWTISGYASGFASALMGEECYVEELSCQATGAPNCIVEGKTKRQWLKEGTCHQEEYSARDLSKELKARQQEISAAEKELRKAKKEISNLKSMFSGPAANIAHRSKAMKAVVALADTVSSVSSTVLITGASGVGKEVLARYIHEQSPRKDKPFVAINCGALPEALLESELFGHTKGAFTGATQDKVGLFSVANGGTLLLDEIGETSPAIQVKLLRVLQENEIRAVGSNSSVPIDVRIIAATNRDLETMVGEGTFRNDLFYRLRVIGIKIPLLRDRKEDILPLVRTFIVQACQQHNLPPKRLSPEAIEFTTSYHWPGNVRELRNAVEHAVILSSQEELLLQKHFPKASDPGKNIALSTSGGIVPFEDFEQRYIMHALDKCDGNRAKTAKALGIGTNTLWRKLKKWGVPPAR